MIDLLRSPDAGAALVLQRGRLRIALAGVAVATAFAAIASARLATEIRIQDVVFGPGRSPLIGVLIEALGVDLTAVLVYTVDRAFGYLVLATAFTPIFLWLLGATAVHAAARLRGSRAPLRPFLVLFGYATALSRVPADATAALLGGAGPVGAQLVQAIGLLGLVWLGVVVWRGIVEVMPIRETAFFHLFRAMYIVVRRCTHGH